MYSNFLYLLKLRNFVSVSRKFIWKIILLISTDSEIKLFKGCLIPSSTLHQVQVICDPLQMYVCSVYHYPGFGNSASKFVIEKEGVYRPNVELTKYRSLLSTWRVPACYNPYHGIVLQMRARTTSIVTGFAPPARHAIVHHGTGISTRS